MLSRRGATGVLRAVRPALSTPALPLRASFATTTQRQATGDPNIDDPEMNGGYINPPRIKRQFRDPYGDWTDKQQRRNFGEPMHEDEDTVNVFSLEEYTHMSSARGALLWAGFLGCVGALSYAVYLTYPDRPSAPKTYDGGLDRELGGPGSLRAYKSGDEFKGSTL